MPAPFRFVLCVVLLESAAALGAPPRTAASAPLTLEQFVMLVGRQHPEKLLTENELLRRRADLERVAPFPSPTWKFGRENQPFGMDAEASPSWSLGVSQEFPWPGTLDQQRAPAAAAIQEQELALQLANLERRLNAAEIFIEMATLAKKKDIEQSSLAEAERWLQILNSQRTSGLGRHGNLIEVQTDAEVLRSEVLSLDAEQRGRELSAALVAGLDPSKRISFSSDLPTVPWNSSVEEAILGGKQEEDLSIRQISARQKTRLDGLQAARSESRPTFMGDLEVMRTDKGMSMWSAMVGIRIPLSGGTIQTSTNLSGELTIKGSEQEDSWYKARRDVALAQSALRKSESERQLLLIETRLIPLRTEHYQALLSDFAQGKAGLSDLNSARRALLKLQAAAIATRRIQQLEAVAQLRIAVGLADATKDVYVPKISLDSEMSSGMSDDGKGMSAGRPMAPKRGTFPRTQSPATAPSTDSDPDTSEKSGSGMRM